MKQFILSLLIILANISSISAGIILPSKISQKNIQYSYKVNESDVINEKTLVTFSGDGIKGNGTGISQGSVMMVLSKSSKLDNYSECYFCNPSKQTLLNKPGVETNKIFPHSLTPFYRLKGLSDDIVYHLDYEKVEVQVPDGKYHQFAILQFPLNPAGTWRVIEESSKQLIEVKNGLLYAPQKVTPPEPDPQFDLSVESIKVTPTSNYLDGDVKASVTIKNNGNKTANNCCVRFFLSKYNSVYKPYQYLFSTVFKLGSLDAGASTTHEETLYFLSQSAASRGSYYIIADVYSSSAEKEDADNTNNQKATLFTVKSSKSLNIINERSFIRINNITEEDLGNTIYITGSNVRSIKQIPINTTGEMMITNQWSDPILFITIVNKDGTKEDLKMNNTK